MLTDCIRCRTKQKQIYPVSVGAKIKANLCHECYNKWFDLRDKIVEETMREFLATPKSK